MTYWVIILMYKWMHKIPYLILQLIFLKWLIYYRNLSLIILQRGAWNSEIRKVVMWYTWQRWCLSIFRSSNTSRSIATVGTSLLFLLEIFHSWRIMNAKSDGLKPWYCCSSLRRNWTFPTRRADIGIRLSGCSSLAILNSLISSTSIVTSSVLGPWKR